MAKTEGKATASVIEERLRTRAQSRLKASISLAAAPLRDMSRVLRDAGDSRGILQALDRIESELYQAHIARAEADEIEEFIKANDATRELLRERPEPPAPKTARAS